MNIYCFCTSLGSDGETNQPLWANMGSSTQSRLCIIPIIYELNYIELLKFTWGFLQNYFSMYGSKQNNFHQNETAFRPSVLTSGTMKFWESRGFEWNLSKFLHFWHILDYWTLKSLADFIAPQHQCSLMSYNVETE